MSTGENAAQTLTEKVKGAANLAHGSGESLRGNVNSFVDNLGSQGQNATNSGQTGTGNDIKDVERDVENRATSSKGKEEMQAGMNAFQK